LKAVGGLEYNQRMLKRDDGFEGGEPVFGASREEAEEGEGVGGEAGGGEGGGDGGGTGDGDDGAAGLGGGADEVGARVGEGG